MIDRFFDRDSRQFATIGLDNISGSEPESAVLLMVFDDGLEFRCVLVGRVEISRALYAIRREDTRRLATLFEDVEKRLEAQTEIIEVYV